MSQLVAYYEDEPIKVRGSVELVQRPITELGEHTTIAGPVQPGVVYVIAPFAQQSPVLVPFAGYDDWSLRDRYNEALRIMNSLGASEIECQSFREVSKKSRLRLNIRARATTGLERVNNSGFDYHHVGSGSAPQDPGPSRWPSEPGFEAARVSVLSNGSSHVTINVRSSSMFTLDSKLGTRLKKLGFDLGVSHETNTVNSLHLTAKFPASKRGGWLNQPGR
jgi:hypothetical protein